MLGLVHGKPSGLVAKSSGYIESLPVEVKKNIEAFKSVQAKQVELQNQYKHEFIENEKVCPSSLFLCGPAGNRAAAMKEIRLREGVVVGRSRRIQTRRIGSPRALGMYWMICVSLRRASVACRNNVEGQRAG